MSPMPQMLLHFVRLSTLGKTLPFAIHDAAGFPPGRHLDAALQRLKDGFVTATQYDVWDAFRDENQLEHTAANAGPVIGDLKDCNLIRQSNYLYS